MQCIYTIYIVTQGTYTTIYVTSQHVYITLVSSSPDRVEDTNTMMAGTFQGHESKQRRLPGGKGIWTESYWMQKSQSRKGRIRRLTRQQQGQRF